MSWDKERIAQIQLPDPADSRRNRGIKICQSSGGKIVKNTASAPIGTFLDRGVNSNEPVSMDFLEDEPFAIANSGTRLHDYISDLQVKISTMLNIQHYVKNYSMLYTLAKAGIAKELNASSL